MHLQCLFLSSSEEYPYKEVLDLTANRCLASRTNAWTDTDHTCYTVYTAGTSGFMNILPIYMDHILFPLLREEDFMTEVHHITAKGEDSGVVYSEMQACGDCGVVRVDCFEAAHSIISNSSLQRRLLQLSPASTFGQEAVTQPVDRFL